MRQDMLHNPNRHPSQDFSMAYSSFWESPCYGHGKLFPAILKNQPIQSPEHLRTTKLIECHQEHVPRRSTVFLHSIPVRRMDKTPLPTLDPVRIDRHEPRNGLRFGKAAEERILPVAYNLLTLDELCSIYNLGLLRCYDDRFVAKVLLCLPDGHGLWREFSNGHQSKWCICLRLWIW